MDRVIQMAAYQQSTETGQDISPNRPRCPKCRDSGLVPAGNGRVGKCDCWIERSIPKRFAGCTFANFRGRAREIMQQDPAGSYFLWGDYRRGKTHLLYAQYRELARTRVKCLVRTTREIIAELTALELEKRESPLLAALDSSERVHLFWDDADKMKPTGFRGEVLYDLVDRIYRHEHGLTMTSNLDIEGLIDVLGSATVRRIDDICVKIGV